MSSSWWSLALAVVLLACTARDPQPCAPSLSATPSPIAPAASTKEPAKPSDVIEVAITVDDLPRHGGDLPGVSRLALHEKMLAVFAKHTTPPVYGFINARGLEGHAEDEQALVKWLAAGHRLGNHTYSHIDGAKASLADYLADVDKNEDALRRLAGSQPEQTRAWKVFRYPYLREGKDLESHAAIRRGLIERGYRLAPVTIDFYDWAYNQAYLRCLEQKREDATPALKESFIDQAAAELRWADGAARQLTGRPIKQILLLHVGHFTGEMLEELLTTYEKQGARFISLDEALGDPIYASEPSPRVSTRGNFLWQIRSSRKTRSPSVAPPPDTLLELVCR